MKILDVRPLAIPDIVVLRFARFGDSRGYFTELFRRSDFDQGALAALPGFDDFTQCNESRSRAGTIRGLHMQWNPNVGKLVRAVTGHMIDLALDIRLGSPTFGQVVAHDMPSAADHPHGEWIWVPPGFAHGTVFLAETVIEYFCTGEYNPLCEAGISPMAPDIDWSRCEPRLRAAVNRVVRSTPLMSEKDRRGLTLSEWRVDPRAGNFVYGSPDVAQTVTELRVKTA